MKTYIRILSFAKPLGQYIPQYILFTLLSIIFGLINFGMLIPLFDVLFNPVASGEGVSSSELPEFSLSASYVIDLFNFYFGKVIVSKGKIGALYFVCLIIVISVLLTNLFRYASAIVLANIRANVIKNIRGSIFASVTSLHLGYFSNKHKGDIMSRLTNDVQEIETSVVNSLRVIFADPAQIIGFFIVLFAMSLKLTLFTLVLLPISGIIISEITKRLRKKATESQESLGKILNIIDETLSGIRIIKAFTAQGYIRKKFQSETDSYARINVSMAKKNELASPLSEFMGVTVVSGILLYGGLLVLNNDTSGLKASQFITYIIIFSQVLRPIQSISNAFSRIQRGLAAATRVFKLMDTKPHINNKKEAQMFHSFDKSVIFRNIHFAYEEKKVLKNINLEIKKGQTIALVGPSGGGKSTLVDLIPRFYDPTQGEILIDSIRLKDYDIESVRRCMGIVTQESILFNDTIFNNIAFAIPEAKEEDVIHAAKIANAHEFIIKAEAGYQTTIGERGVKLSGGQRQRLSIARAILKNPPILILDEATSALDSESEKLVQDALTKLMKNRTSIVIAHRLSTIQHADEIIVIQEGEIIERGTHQDLIKSDGLYKKLNMMQAL